jgi:RNA-directed DNA polymerase
MGQVLAAVTGSKNMARHHTSFSRESGDPQLALPFDVVDGEHPGQAQQAKSLGQKLRKSDRVVVPEKLANKAENHFSVAESVEERTRAKGKCGHRYPHRTLGRIMDGKTSVARIGQRAQQQAALRHQDRDPFTNLFNHLRFDLLKAVFDRLRKSAAPGVDGVTWQTYSNGLESRLLDLQDRLHRGVYHPPPVRRVYIPKADGKRRPLGIPALEDKIVQGAVVSLLTPIYEAQFKDSSYGFRPRRSAHQALHAVDEMMYGGKVSWVVDADIRGFFDNIDHEWMLRFVEHQIGDGRIVTLIKRWLKAGVMEDSVLRKTTQGTPQGGSVTSPTQ